LPKVALRGVGTADKALSYWLMESGTASSTADSAQQRPFS